MEEERIHIHVICPEGEAKFWIEPIIALEFVLALARRWIRFGFDR